MLLIPPMLLSSLFSQASANSHLEQTFKQSNNNETPGLTACCTNASTNTSHKCPNDNPVKSRLNACYTSLIPFILLRKYLAQAFKQSNNNETPGLSACCKNASTNTSHKCPNDNPMKSRLNACYTNASKDTSHKSENIACMALHGVT